MINSEKFKILFYVAYPYYFPHFLPIEREARKRGWKTVFLLSDQQNSRVMKNIAQNENLNWQIGDHLITEIEREITLFANPFPVDEKIRGKRAFLCHGIGTKECGFERAIERDDLIFVEGSYREEKYKNLFPDSSHKIARVGYSKLDGVVDIDKERLLHSLGLDPDKKTILYAPTFYPSSIGKMSNSFVEDFREYNIILKPHYLTFERKRYRKDVHKLNLWSERSGVKLLPVDEVNLLPFIAVSDIMISDESSAIFEAVALGKPVILNRFLKLRWSYIFNPKKYLKRIDSGMDRYREVAVSVESYREMVTKGRELLVNGEKHLSNRLISDVTGVVDGRVSERICNKIEEIL